MDIQAYIETGVIESYVLGMANPHEAAELEQLSRQYPEIKQAIDEFEASLEKQAFANAVKPPSSVKDSLMLTLKDEFAKEEDTRKVVPIVPSLDKGINNQTPVRSIAGRLKYVAAASVILLVASAGLNIYLYKEAKDARVNYLALLKENSTIIADRGVYQTRMLDMYNSMQLMSDPAMVKVAMSGVKDKEELATVFWDSKTKDVYLLANKLPETPDNKQYQLWAMVDGKPVDAGILGDCNGLCKLKNIPNAQAFAITLEKKGGSPSPDLAQLHVFGKVG